MHFPSSLSPLSFLALASTLTACGGAAPPADTASFHMVRDGSALSFDKVGVAASTGTGGAIELTFNASSGCGGQIDGCSAFTLTLNLDTTGVAPGASLAIDGTTTYTINPTKGLYPFSFAPAANGSPAVKSLGLLEGCAPCSAPGSYTQALTGNVALSSVSATHVAGTLHTGLTGKIPNDWDVSSTATIDAVFDVEVQ